MTGYSGTPLARKLGIKASSSLFVQDPPAHYQKMLAPLPAGVRFHSSLSPAVDVVHIFSKSKLSLTVTLKKTMMKLRPDASIWVSWPKKASKVATDIREDTVRAIALPLGLVDVKVCAVDEIWSGLKLVLRKENRPTRA
jgi:hypothetical protein